jgi:hypothetical protein
VVTEAEALRSVRGETRTEFDPTRVALVEREPGAIDPPVLSGSLPSDASVQVLGYKAGQIVLETRVSQPAFLVVSEKYFPGWRAEVDGQSVQVYQTDYLLCGLAVPAGKHKIEMTFHAEGAKLGFVISLMTVVFLAALSVYHLRTKRAGQVPSKALESVR